ncbi:MAG TPA: RNA 2',3'-cyclic phosphodiesterase [Candidatus Limnocylindrales bacterium]|nr:RNA 2',3'-cyclic phosphodiesterase [Candidatus Limnocylindrales bacterium]
MSQRRGDPHAGVPGRRLFVGVPLPDAAAKAVAAIVDEVRAAGLPDGARDVRWVRLDGLHLTLRFLGPTPEGLVGPTAEAVTAVARAADGPVELELTGAGTFPRAARPRALWIGVAGATDALDRLAKLTERHLVAAGWPPEPRPYRPHLTLARSDGVSVGPLVAGRLVAAMTGRSIPCTIEHIGLFESVTGGGPARYVPVALEGLGSSSSAHPPVYHQTTPDPT